MSLQALCDGMLNDRYEIFRLYPYVSNGGYLLKQVDPRARARSPLRGLGSAQERAASTRQESAVPRSGI